MNTSKTAPDCPVSPKKDDENNYFNITENFKEYPLQPWTNSDDVACFGVPCDEGLTIMTPFDAAAFISSNDMMSMIAMRIPKDKWDELQEMVTDEDGYVFEIKGSYYIDYIGKSII